MPRWWTVVGSVLTLVWGSGSATAHADALSGLLSRVRVESGPGAVHIDALEPAAAVRFEPRDAEWAAPFVQGQATDRPLLSGLTNSAATLELGASLQDPSSGNLSPRLIASVALGQTWSGFEPTLEFRPRRLSVSVGSDLALTALVPATIRLQHRWDQVFEIGRFITVPTWVASVLLEPDW